MEEVVGDLDVWSVCSDADVEEEEPVPTAADEFLRFFLTLAHLRTLSS